MAWDRRKILDEKTPRVVIAGIDCSTGKTRTKQAFKNECDINRIMRKYTKTGVISQDSINRRQAIFTDVTEALDYQESANYILQADKAFMDLPANIRTRFGNDPGELLTFLQDNKNQAEAVTLGIIPKPEQVAAAAVPPLTPTEAPTGAPTTPPKAT